MSQEYIQTQRFDPEALYGVEVGSGEPLARPKTEHIDEVVAPHLVPSPLGESLNRNPGVIDRAYEEYCRRLENGTPPDPDEFCDQFQTCKVSLRRLIEAQQYLEENSFLLAEGPPFRWPEPGESFLGFNLIRELGRGAFARVFLAVEPALGNRQVAVKVSLQGNTEAETLGRISHPNIVPVHSVHGDKESRLTVVCMPYLGSATLCNILDRVSDKVGAATHARLILDVACQALPEGAIPADSRPPDQILMRGSYVDGVVFLGAQLADALAYIHGMGICHRDMKPSNVLLSPDGRPMLLDFNLSIDQKSAHNRWGGTLPYMAPEQLQVLDQKGAALQIPADPRSDLFALGVMLFELLAGKHPFGSFPLKMSWPKLRAELLERQEKGFQPLREVNPHVDPRLAHLVETCLAHDPNDRPQSAAVLARGLRQCLGSWQRLRRWAIDHPLTFVGVASVLITLVAYATFAVMVMAFQDPYHLREMKMGEAAFEQHRFQDAVQHFSHVIEKNPTPQAFFARGLAEQKQEDWKGAIADYQEGQKRLKDQNQEPDGKVFASMGYCLNKRILHNDAVKNYDQALKAGFAPAEVHNNLGFTYLICPNQSSNAKVKFDNAIDSLNKAITLNGGLQAAYYNRARADLSLAGLNPCHFPYQGIEDVEKALAIGPRTADLCQDAARIYAVASQRMDPVRTIMELNNLPGLSLSFGSPATLAPYGKTWLQPGLKCLQEAIQLGLNPEELKKDYLLRIFQGSPEFQALLKAAKPDKPFAPAVRLLDPAAE